MLDVAIAGGGPGGLACAHAVRRAMPHATVKVFEGTQRIVPQGAGVLLNVNGLAALHAIDPALEQRITEGGGVIMQNSMTYRNLQGELSEALAGSGIVPPSDFKVPPVHSPEFRKKYGRNMLTRGWHEIRQCLYDALPPDVVQLAMKVTGYEEVGESVTVLFQDSAEPVKARILIGADGYFSKVRQVMLGDGPPTFQGNVSWRSRMDHQPGLPPVTESTWWREDWFRKRWAVIYSFSPTRQCVSFSAPVSMLEERGLTYDHTQKRSSVQHGEYGPTALSRCRQVFEGADPFLLNILDNVLEPSTVTEHGVYARAPDSLPDKEYGRGRVALVGDAAHVGPVNGQGLNLTMEDAAVLGFHLREGGLNADSLRRYEAERAPRVKEIIRDVTDFKTDRQKERLLWLTTYSPLHVEPGQSAPAPVRCTQELEPPA